MTFTTATWVMLVLVAALVGLAKTALPGLAVLAAALLASILPAKESTGTLLLLLLVGDVMAIGLYRRDADFGTLRRLVPTVLVGVALGGVYLQLASDLATKRLIGIVLLTMIGLTLVDIACRRGAVRATVDESKTSPVKRGLYGSLAGFTTMVANAGGPVTSMYFMQAGFDVARFLGTTAWFFFLVNVVKLPVSIGVGIITPDTVRTDLLLAPVVVASCLVGFRLARSIPKKVFDPIVWILTVISSCWLLV
ncbi:sulfite exporter TauE/SafE family protein [Luteococcus sp. OSA5]|uniref:sulfite exporter TauE/SafE family protein n=1 Tax=Luteococcus sp. OSA5 TaxID=3401630 RepID=UPI003B438B1E